MDLSDLKLLGAGLFPAVFLGLPEPPSLRHLSGQTSFFTPRRCTPASAGLSSSTNCSCYLFTPPEPSPHALKGTEQ